MTLITQLGWRLYSLLHLALQPHAFFAQLYALDWYQAMLRDWVAWLQPERESHILEVGCSSGGFSATLAMQGHRVSALDRSTRAIRFAQQHHVSDQLTFVSADALQLPWRSAQFDLTLAASLVNVVDSPLELVTEMRRVTKVNGSVSCLFPTPDMHRDAAKTFVRASGLRGFSANALMLWAGVAHKFAVTELEQMFRDAGLVNVHHTTLLQGMVAAVTGTKTS